MGSLRYFAKLFWNGSSTHSNLMRLTLKRAKSRKDKNFLNRKKYGSTMRSMEQLLMNNKLPIICWICLVPSCQKML